jgi:hypothetical protein
VEFFHKVLNLSETGLSFDIGATKRELITHIGVAADVFDAHCFGLPLKAIGIIKTDNKLLCFLLPT